MKQLYRRIKHPFKKAYMKLRYGINCCDLYSYDYYLAKKLAHDLKLFKKYSCSYPAELTDKKWDDILDEIIDGFVNYEDDKYTEKTDKAIKLLSKWFSHLWY